MIVHRNTYHIKVVNTVDQLKQYINNERPMLFGLAKYTIDNAENAHDRTMLP